MFNTPPGETPPQAPDRIAAPPALLRGAALLLSSAQTLYWLWALWLAIRAADRPADAAGIDLMPALFATPPFLAATAPALLLSLLGLAPRQAFWLALAGAVLTPLIGWQALFARWQGAGL